MSYAGEQPIDGVVVMVFAGATASPQLTSSQIAHILTRARDQITAAGPIFVGGSRTAPSSAPHQRRRTEAYSPPAAVGQFVPTPSFRNINQPSRRNSIRGHFEQSVNHGVGGAQYGATAAVAQTPPAPFRRSVQSERRSSGTDRRRYFRRLHEYLLERNRVHREWALNRRRGSPPPPLLPSPAARGGPSAPSSSHHRNSHLNTLNSSQLAENYEIQSSLASTREQIRATTTPPSSEQLRSHVSEDVSFQQRRTNQNTTRRSPTNGGGRVFRTARMSAAPVPGRNLARRDDYIEFDYPQIQQTPSLFNTHPDIFMADFLQRATEQRMAAAAMAPEAEAAGEYIGASESAIENLERLESFDGEDRCAICLEEMDGEIGGRLIRLDCEHIFHENCLVPWLRKSNACPLCRGKKDSCSS
ncbi:E3 ubiquitin-protein ligase RDUF1 [Linum perenne]